MTFEAHDIGYLESIGKTQQESESELELLRTGVPSINLHKRCTAGDGITALTREQELKYVEIYDKAMLEGRCMKFVAASGAASRMFNAPIRCLQKGWTTRDLLDGMSRQGDCDAEDCLQLMTNLSKFAFFSDLKYLMSSKKLDLEYLLKGGEYGSILENLLEEDGLGYGTMPKALIPFHLYTEGARTALEEHLIESAGYLVDHDKVARIHFTLSPDHEDKVREHVKKVLSSLESTGIHFDVEFSVQAHSTNTVVLDQDNDPLRDDAGQVLLRPSGHGALLENLNSLQGDIVFIRTIDNVLPDEFKDLVCFYNKILGGYLLALQEELFRFLRILSTGDFDEAKLMKIVEFAELKMNVRLPEGFSQMCLGKKAGNLFKRMNAPLRVCGMVRNSSYPGGRPFWIADKTGVESLQIVESAQIDKHDQEQKRIWNSCEFFNPADIVCGVRDYEGKCFDMTEFIDPELSFVSEKTYKGRRCMVLERPGLWNGCMAYWNTVFLEIPALTLHPVKTILDLLNKQN